MKLGFIGFGEAAYEISAGIRQEGPVEIVAYDPAWNHPVYGELVRERAAKAQVRLAERPELVLNGGIQAVIVAVPADQAYEVSCATAPCLKSRCVYVDVSAANPEVKRQIHAKVKEAGAPFVDAAMMGPLVVFKHKVPILASGDGTDTFMSYMAPYGMKIEKVSDTAGDASAVKLVRSIYMKGIAALFIEMLEAARRFQVEELVIRSLGETLDGAGFEFTMNRMVTSTSIHAGRRAAELEGAIRMLESVGMKPVLSYAVRDKLQRVADLKLREKFQGKTPTSWPEVIAALQG